jgi:putative endonuclease
MWLFDWLRGFRGGRGDPLGRRAEDLAARFCRRQLGWRILARNVRCPGGELDIVALAGETLVFVEVRALTSTAFMRPEETLKRDKRRFLARSARWFVRSRRLGRFSPRGDLVAIVWPRGGEPVVRHYAGAWCVGMADKGR